MNVNADPDDQCSFEFFYSTAAIVDIILCFKMFLTQALPSIALELSLGSNKNGPIPAHNWLQDFTLLA